MGSKKKHSSDTKQYKIKRSKKENKADKIKVRKHPILRRVILIFVILIFLLVLVGGGILAGIFFSDKWSITKEELISSGNTEVYDSDGKQIAILSASEGNGNRKVITLDQMGKYTANAYIAIEDKRFYEHSGVDILRTAKATISYVLRKGSSDVGGGSTITQQLVKNIMKDKADTGAAGMERKIREMSRAYKVESMLTKNQIIEKYLNIIFIGGNDLHGVEYGAQYYFAKSAKDLDLAESAFLAGINDGPNMYNPYGEEDNSERIKARTKLVLSFMKEQNRISDDPTEAENLYNEAVEKVEKGFEFKKGTIEIGNISYFVSEAVNNAARDLAEAKDIDFAEAKAMIQSGGYKLYTTQVTSIQETVLKEMAKKQYVQTRTITVKDEDGKNVKIKDQTQAGTTIIDHTNGRVVAMGGALGSDQGTNINFATITSKQTGSSIKPLVNIAPGLEEKAITAATVFDDTPTTFSGNYSPKNAVSYLGLCTVRKAIEVSSNIVNIKIAYNVGIDKAIDYLHEFGLTTYTKEDDADMSLAIGGASHSSSTLQMAAAYATLANKGVYIEPTFYTKLTDSDGNIIVEPKQETRRVISEANAFIISDILTDVVTGYSGTASTCAISGMDVACKTGTSDADKNVWLCGYTPYYAGATWYGFDREEHSLNQIWAARSIWGNIMKSVHKDLDKKRFTKPDGVVTATVCKDSGKIATKECTKKYTEYFTKGNVPKACDGHETIKICKESGKVATEYCLDTEEKVYTAKPEKENNSNWVSKQKDRYKVPTEKCTIHTEETSSVVIPNLIGKTEAEAKLALAGLNIQVIYETHGDQANGIVLKQSLTEGTKVLKGVSIVLTVNKVSVTPPPTPEEPDTNTETPGGNTETPSTNNETSTGGNTTEPSSNTTN